MRGECHGKRRAAAKLFDDIRRFVCRAVVAHDQLDAPVDSLLRKIDANTRRKCHGF